MMYKIIEANSVRAMAYEVGVALDSEWRPVGGVSVVTKKDEGTSSPIALYQAMVKRTREDQDGGPGSYF